MVEREAAPPHIGLPINPTAGDHATPRPHERLPRKHLLSEEYSNQVDGMERRFESSSSLEQLLWSTMVCLDPLVEAGASLADIWFLELVQQGQQRLALERPPRHVCLSYQECEADDRRSRGDHRSPFSCGHRAEALVITRSQW